MCPLRQLVEFLLQILRKPGLQHLPLHLLPESHDLPGHFAVLSVVEARRDVRDDFDLDGPIEGIGGYPWPPPTNRSPLVWEKPCRNSGNPADTKTRADTSMTGR